MNVLPRFSRHRPFVTLAGTAVVAALVLCALTGCTSAGFYWQAARGQLALISAREPVDEVLADDALDPRLRAKLILAYDARQFAAAELGLPDNKPTCTSIARTCCGT